MKSERICMTMDDTHWRFVRTRKETEMKLTFATCMNFDGDDDSSDGFSVIEQFRLEENDLKRNVMPGGKEDLGLELTVIGKEAKWRVKRQHLNIWCIGFPVGDTFSEKEFSSFDEVVEYLTADEMPAFADFMDYVADCLEEQSKCYPDCKTLLIELIARKGVKQVEDEQHG